MATLANFRCSFAGSCSSGLGTQRDRWAGGLPLAISRYLSMIHMRIIMRITDIFWIFLIYIISSYKFQGHPSSRIMASSNLQIPGRITHRCERDLVILEILSVFKFEAWHGMAWHGMAWHGITCKICKSIKASPLQKDNLAADYLQIPSDKPLKACWWLLMKLENRRLPDWDVKKILKKAVSCWFLEPGVWSVDPLSQFDLRQLLACGICTSRAKAPTITTQRSHMFDVMKC